MNQLLNYKYYLTPYPASDFHFTKITLGISLGIIIAGLLWSYYRKKMLKDKIARKILRPYPGKLITYGFIALFLLAVREAGIPYFSMRLWWLVLLALLAFSMIKLALTYKAEYEKRAKKAAATSHKKNYLPKKKK